VHFNPEAFETKEDLAMLTEETVVENYVVAWRTEHEEQVVVRTDCW